jgi:hypothetical protein
MLIPQLQFESRLERFGFNSKLALPCGLLPAGHLQVRFPLLHRQISPCRWILVLQDIMVFIGGWEIGDALGIELEICDSMPQNRVLS